MCMQLEVHAFGGVHAVEGVDAGLGLHAVGAVRAVEVWTLEAA